MIAMNKNLSKELFKKNKIKTPKYFFYCKRQHLNIDLREKIKKNRLSFPIVVKPNNEGSSIGVKICKNFKSLIREFKKLSKIYENLLFETYIPAKFLVCHQQNYQHLHQNNRYHMVNLV